MKTHMHQEGIDMFINHIIRLSRESRVDSQAGPKMV